MPLFNKRPEIPRSQFKDILKRADIKIGQGRQLSQREKERIEKIDFPKKLGATISKSEYNRTLNKLKSEKINEQDFAKKIKIGRELRFLKDLEKKDL